MADNQDATNDIFVHQGTVTTHMVKEPAAKDNGIKVTKIVAADLRGVSHEMLVERIEVDGHKKALEADITNRVRYLETHPSAITNPSAKSNIIIEPNDSVWEKYQKVETAKALSYRVEHLQHLQSEGGVKDNSLLKSIHDDPSILKVLSEAQDIQLNVTEVTPPHHATFSQSPYQRQSSREIKR